MELRRELLVMIGGLVLLNLLLVFGAVGLFVRMGPAIERILQENVASIVAAEQMLVELAESANGPLGAGARDRVRQALEQAKQNVTEKEERPVLDALERQLALGLDGEPDARRQVIAGIGELIRINHHAMRSVDQEAQRLGSAGAWAAVLLGFLSFLSSLLVVVRLQKRLVGPLLDLYEVLDSARQGNRVRRCRLADAPREVEQVMHLVNRLLDERLQRPRGDTAVSELPPSPAS